MLSKVNNLRSFQQTISFCFRLQFFFDLNPEPSIDLKKQQSNSSNYKIPLWSRLHWDLIFYQKIQKNLLNFFLEKFNTFNQFSL